MKRSVILQSLKSLEIHTKQREHGIEGTQMAYRFLCLACWAQMDEPALVCLLTGTYPEIKPLAQFSYIASIICLLYIFCILAYFDS